MGASGDKRGAAGRGPRPPRFGGRALGRGPGSQKAKHPPLRWRLCRIHHPEQPIASASLAQVHEARLPDGRRCAVKVQYPGIAARVNADLRNLMFVLRILAWLESNFDFRAVAREMLKYVPMELDFVNEGHNC